MTGNRKTEGRFAGRALYFECNAGISGDMTLGALIHLGADVEQIRSELKKLDIGPFDLIPNPVIRNSIAGVNLDVVIQEPSDQIGHNHDHNRDAHHGHNTYVRIRDMILDSGLSPQAKQYAIDIFTVIGRAEAAVHEKPLEEVAFHEVGAMDSILDIAGTAVAIDLLGNPKILCGPVHDGQGFIECRHGTIPVPVPAVMEMLKGSHIPIVIESEVHTEMVTPTGFGILEGLHATFLPTAGLRVEKVGYGFGKRETKAFNALRVILGEQYVEEADVEEWEQQ
jgi:uncharacterized protein (TIGR00299 family) protein